MEVKGSGTHNFKKSKKKVPSGFNVAAWEKYKDVIDDKQVIDFIAHGFPVDYTGPNIPLSTMTNHNSANKFPEHIEAYIQKELEEGALLGPFAAPPFE